MRTRPIVVALLALSLLVVGVAPARGQESQGTACTARSDNDAVVRAFFGPLFERLGPIVGSPVGCIGEAPDGGVSVPTTTGLLYARPEGGGPVRLVAFTDGFRHWAVDANLTQVTLYWEGEAAYPPAQGVSRLPIPSGAPTTPWPPSPVPTVGARPTPPPAVPRPATGEDLGRPTYAGGRGQLSLKNQLPFDAAFKLRDADGARAARAFVFVRAGEETTLDGVKPGTYQIQDVVGSDWDGQARIFRRTLGAAQLDHDLVFTEEQTDEGIVWVVQTVTLYRTEGDQGSGIPIDLAEFQKE